MRCCRSILAGLLACATVLGAADALAQLQPGPVARRQIAALLQQKAARTQVERKLSSRLIYAARMRRGRDVAPGVRGLRTGVRLDARGQTLVDLRAEVTPRLLARIEAMGGEVVGSWPARRAVRARLPVEGCESVASLPEVRKLRPAAHPVTHMSDVSEGVVAHKADVVQSQFGVDGSGITVAVLSDGVDALASVQASGDLPAVTVLPGQAGSGTEGTAMLEIIHDLAPGASLLFATAFNGQASFASNIIALRDAGADVIVDDVRYFQEAVFQDDDVADAIDTVTADGALFFSSVGNEGNVDSGTGGVWEGDFASSGTMQQGGLAHDFGGGVTGNRLTRDPPFSIFLQWSDPLGASGNDYDLFLLDSTMSSVVASSTDTQNGNDDPLEIIDSFSRVDTGNHLVVVRDSGQSRFLHLNVFRGELDVSTLGQVSAHPGAAGAIGVGAVDARFPGGAGGVFDGSETVQKFSSDGPRRIFFDANGTPYTPGMPLSTGGIVRSKPDLVAADCVDTATPGLSRFCGSSAAAPHAAGIAALLLEIGQPLGLGAAEVRAAMLTTTFDIEAPGTDELAGHGLLDALAAAEQLTAKVPSLGPAGLAGLGFAVAGVAWLSLRRRATQSPKRCSRTPTSRQAAP